MGSTKLTRKKPILCKTFPNEFFSGDIYSQNTCVCVVNMHKLEVQCLNKNMFYSLGGEQYIYVGVTAL